MLIDRSRITATRRLFAERAWRRPPKNRSSSRYYEAFRCVLACVLVCVLVLVLVCVLVLVLGVFFFFFFFFFGGIGTEAPGRRLRTSWSPSTSTRAIRLESRKST